MCDMTRLDSEASRMKKGNHYQTKLVVGGYWVKSMVHPQPMVMIWPNGRGFIQSGFKSTKHLRIHKWLVLCDQLTEVTKQSRSKHFQRHDVFYLSAIIEHNYF